MAQNIPLGYFSAAFYLEGGVGTSPFVTTLGLKADDISANPVEVANVAFSAYALNFMPSTSSDLTLTRVVLSVGIIEAGSPTVESDLPAVVGAGTGAYLPLSCALILNKNTAVLGRRGRGRMFIPGVVKDADADISGRLGPNTVDAFNGVAQDFLDYLGTPVGDEPALTPWLFHQEGPGTRPPDAISALSCGAIVGTVRRRIK